MIFETAVSLLYPRVCPGCGIILKKGQYICRFCYEELDFPDGRRCGKCSRPLKYDEEVLCADCMKENRFFDEGIALLMHSGEGKKIIYDLKFSNRRDNADFLAYEAANRYHDLFCFWQPEVMIPVPLHKRKEKERGFNQARLLADRTSFFLNEKGLGIPVDPYYLTRSIHTKPMKTLDRIERSENLKGAFSIKLSQKPHSPYKRILLVDDIYTTGSTLSECAKVLKAAGADRVYFLTFSIG